MTINVVVSTYDAVVLGCDSLSSVVERAIFPFRHGTEFAVDGNGDRILDCDGNFVFPFSSDKLAYTATSVMGGVRKMFPLVDDGGQCECSIAAITSGMATLNGVTIAQIALGYQRKLAASGLQFATAEAACQNFLEFIRARWELQLVGVDAAARAQHPLNFLVGGYCCDDEYIKVFRIDVAENTVVEQFGEDVRYGATWDGQSDFASRLIKGIDATLHQKITRGIAEALVSQRTSIVKSFVTALTQAGVQFPEGFSVEFEEAVAPSLPFSAGEAQIDWPNLPVQSAVELVSALVNAESGMQKFARGIPMVGGRTRIGLLRRNSPFEMLNEPNLSHTHLGYATDA